jgi:histidine ammonia-lyase
MGTIAARDALRVLELTEQVVAAMLIAARQALALRLPLSKLPLPAPLTAFLERLSNEIALVQEDRALDADLQRLLAGMRAGKWRLYDHG